MRQTEKGEESRRDGKRLRRRASREDVRNACLLAAEVEGRPQLRPRVVAVECTDKRTDARVAQGRGRVQIVSVGGREVGEDVRDVGRARRVERRDQSK